MPKTNEEYARMVKAETPPSPMVKNCLLAFLTGGAICAAGQGITELWLMAGLARADAAAAASITLVFLGAFLTGLGIYDDIAKFAGAGTLVPITGFANSIVSPALEFKSEGYIPGMSAKMFTIAGPVLVFGISASVIYGLVLYIFGLFA
jgi:stage V sporulation protein AC